MNRRQFTQKTAMLGSVLLLPKINDAMTAKPNYKMGLQLFSIHQDMLDAPINTLKSVKKMGYQDFEIYGFDDQKITYYGIQATEFKKRLDDLNLSVSSGHYGFSDYFTKSQDDLRHFVDQCIKGAKALNSPYITWPWLDPKLRTIENFKLLPTKLNLIGEQIKAAGLNFAYHNHGFEFDDHQGENGYDIILKETDPSLVKLQMDMYWVMHAATTTPKELVQKHPGRFVMWHIKDMDTVTRDYTELGNGAINYLKTLPDPNTSGLEYYYIEQGGNFTHNALRSAADSAQYFKKHLQKFL